MGQSIVDLIPTYMCLIAAAFLLGNTRFIRFFRQLLPAIIACIICYRVYVHVCADYSKTDHDVVSFFHILISAIDVVFKKCSKSVGAVLGDIIGLLMILATLSTLQDLAFLKFSVVKKQFFDEVYAIVRHIPTVKSLLVKEQTKIEEHFEKDLKDFKVKAMLFNAQASEPSVQRLLALARQQGIPVVGISETEPAGLTYQAWMLGQLDALDKALGAPR